MGSLGEEELIQMVQDFIESESPSTISFTSTQSLPLNHQSTHPILEEILGCVTDVERDVLEKVLNFLRNVRTIAMKSTNLKKRLVKMLRMEGFDASLCRTCWISTSGWSQGGIFSGGDYEYIDIMKKNEDGSSVRLIVDIDFKSQFELARPTPTYRELSNTLPTIFVGSEENIGKIISLLCTAAKQSLKERGLHIPPWRKRSYMQSKWLSDYQKVSINREAGRDKIQAKGDGHSSSKFGKWAPPVVKPKRRDLNGRSGLSSQFSNMGINCC